MSRRIRNVAVAAAVAGATMAALSQGANAQLLDRSQVVRIVVPYTAGGPPDITMRYLGGKIQAAGGPTIVIDNRPGGGQVIGAMVVKDAKPDGLTLFLTDVPTFAINKTLMKELPYDPVKDFKPITTIFSFPSLLLVPGVSPAKTAKELAEIAKNTPGGFAYATQGVGAGGHILGEMFGKAIGAKLTAIHYKGSATAYPDVIANRVGFIFGSYAGGKPFLESGQMRALAVPASKRISLIPDVPTMSELGYPDADLDFWYGLVAPAGTPDAAIARIRELFHKEMAQPEFQQRMDAQGLAVIPNTPAEYAAMIQRDINRLAPIVRESGAVAN